MATTKNRKIASKKTPAKTHIAEVTMTLERVTKNTYRFAADDDDAPIDTLYVHKDWFDNEPSTITVTITS